MKCAVFSHLKENFYGKEYKIKLFTTKSIFVNDNGIFSHQRNNISNKYENCFYKTFSCKKGENFVLETVHSYYLSKDDIEGADESYRYSLPRSYFSIFKDGNWYFLSPEVSSMFTINYISKEE
eukprot:snap_masked-scaffold_21-processed-gene-5.71-mRNA-1 protein AED:1.00 eAED:1.00 QI:0/-1/0/0/-1/1/1/0/122